MNLITMPAAIVISGRCHWCTKQKAPHDLLPIGDGGACMCLNCYEWHCKALNFIATNGLDAPDGCQECGRTLTEIATASPDGNSRLYLVPKDGIYQVHCPACLQRYEQLNRGIVHGTDYGSRKGL